MKRNNALKFIILTSLLILVLGVAGILGYALYKGTNRLLVENELGKPNEKLSLIGARLVTRIKEFENDVSFLSGTPPIQGIIRSQKAGGIDPLESSTYEIWRERLGTIFTELLRAKPQYLQIRYIGLEENGREIVRAQKEGDRIVKVDGRDLQSKSQRPYFEKTIRLKNGQVFLSKISLNREHGKVVEPHVPVIRAAIPIFDRQRKVFGIIIINMNMGSVLNQFTEKEKYFYITNDHGDFLEHPDSSIIFGYDLGLRHRIQDTYPEISSLMNPNGPHSKSFLSETASHNRVVHLHKVFFDELRPGRFWAFVEAVDYEAVISGSPAFRNRLIFPSFTVVIGVTLLLIIVITRRSLKMDDSFMPTAVAEFFFGKGLSDEEFFKTSLISAREKAPLLLIALCIFLAGGIFLVDYTMPLGVAAGVPYVLLVLLALWMPRKYIVYFALIGTFLTILGFYISPAGGETGKAVWNRGLSLFAIWAAALLSLMHRKIGDLWQKSEKRLRTVMDNVADGIITIDPQGTIITFNPATEKIFGYSAEELSEKNIKILMPEPYNSEHDSYIQNYRKTGEGRVIGKGALELSGRRKDGSVFPLELAISEARLGSELVFIGLVKDITERKRADEELRKSQELFKTLASISPVGIWHSDPEGGCVFINEKCSKLISLPLNEAMGDGWSQFLHPEDRDRIAQDWKDFSEGKREFQAEYRFKNKEGKVTWVIGQAIAEKNESGQVTGFVGTLTDITELKNTETKLMGSLHEKDILLKELHHRTKNNLQIVSSLLNIQSDRVENESVRKVFTESIDRIQSIALLHENIYKSGVFADIRLEKYVRTLAEGLLHSYGYNSDQISLKVQSDVLSLGIDKSLYCGLIINELVSNSLKYAFPGTSDNEIRISIHRLPGDNLELRVSDNGVGIEEDKMAANQSMGLQVVSLLAKDQLDGTLEIYNSGGAVFKIIFKDENYHDRE